MTSTRPLSVQLYSVRDALAADRRATLPRLAAAGFRAVEPFDVGGDPADTAALRADLADAGLRAPWAHVDAPLGPRAAPVLDAAAALGVAVLVIPAPGCVAGFGPDAFGAEASVRAFAEQLGQAAENAHAAGFRLAYHNHWWEFAPLPDGRLPYDLLIETAGDRLELEVDAYWAQTAGQPPAELVARYASRVRSLHVKDGPARQGVPQVVAGQGVVDLRGSIAAGTSVEWHVLEFDETTGDPVDGLVAGAQWLVAAGLSTWELP